jgi:hypothetical protein
MAQGGYDIYLVDYFLEDRTGLDLLRESALPACSSRSARTVSVTGARRSTAGFFEWNKPESRFIAIVKGLQKPKKTH